MRLFLALDLPKETKRKLSDQINSLQKGYPHFRWVGEDNYHITLLFFGDQFKTPYLIRKIQDAVYDSSEFYLYSLHADLFLRGKIILYLAFRRNKELESIVHKIKENLAMDTAKKFVPHLTLGRYKVPSKQQYLHLKKKLRNLVFDIEFRVPKLILFNSKIETPKPLRVYHFSWLHFPSLTLLS
ncbi:RNA 2',3'-cyclic phosphodiesterase [Candidatus Roizmanbacteria bacterium]|nr:RNA 2',3'-cyclic phosphodiesterase [Candidatus Roizmanbacteria bacterium]